MDQDIDVDLDLGLDDAEVTDVPEAPAPKKKGPARARNACRHWADREDSVRTNRAVQAATRPVSREKSSIQGLLPCGAVLW